ncbi:MAG TPA: triose-phosphate isomerase [Chthonomonadales bacterium]|nr:triose-phosphate isomerase [Chthonomonadales bacterium]
MRRTIIAGNWKMHKTVSEAVFLIDELKPAAAARPDVDVVVCPPYTALDAARRAVEGSAILLGAQDVFWKASGAYTSQIAPAMLTDLGVRLAIVGHSETRGRFGVPEPDFDADVLRHFGETDATVNRKIRAAIVAGLTPICCVGETLAERQAGATDSVVASQVEGALKEIPAAQVAGLVFAYEPVWAIGTGEVCEAAEANRVCGVIRSTVGAMYGPDVAEAVRVQYGGSVKPDNAADLLGREHIDGALVGGAALKAADFAAIIAASPTG